MVFHMPSKIQLHAVSPAQCSRLLMRNQPQPVALLKSPKIPSPNTERNLNSFESTFEHI